jgi:hypothetical protein
MRKVVSERDSILAKYEMIKEIVQGKIVPSLSE